MRVIVVASNGTSVDMRAGADYNPSVAADLVAHAQKLLALALATEEAQGVAQKVEPESSE